jgi:pimeloyl-ACP methyl ester carboxylesterase
MVEITRHHANGIRLAVVSRSPRQEIHPPVLLLPGTGATASDWDAVATDMSQDRTVHALDLRGHGRSEWPGTYSIDLMAADLLDLMPKLGAQLDLIGHSLGGIVACLAVASGVSGPRRLVLEDVGLLHPRAPSTPTRPEGDLDFDWAMVEQIRPEIDRPRPDWPEALARVTVPTLAIGGGPSSFMPREHVAELVALVQHGHLITIEAGHSIHAARPKEFIREVRAFLDA